AAGTSSGTTTLAAVTAVAPSFTSGPLAVVEIAASGEVSLGVAVANADTPHVDVRFAAGVDGFVSQSAPSQSSTFTQAAGLIVEGPAKFLAPSAVDLAISTTSGHHGHHLAAGSTPDSDESLSDFFESLSAS